MKRGEPEKREKNNRPSLTYCPLTDHFDELLKIHRRYPKAAVFIIFKECKLSTSIERKFTATHFHCQVETNLPMPSFLFCQVKSVSSTTREYTLYGSASRLQKRAEDPVSVETVQAQAKLRQFQPRRVRMVRTCRLIFFTQVKDVCARRISQA